MIIHILLARYLIEGLINHKIDFFGGEIDEKKLFLTNVKYWVHHFFIGVAIIVVAVTEGIPLGFTILLAYSIDKMS